MSDSGTPTTGDTPPASNLSPREAEAWSALDAVLDPEVPAVSIVDLGIVRAIEVSPDGDSVTATLTPTYSGCPALEVIERDAGAALLQHFTHVEVRTALRPAWTTDWMTERGRERLREYGIAPPTAPAAAPEALTSMKVLATVGTFRPDPACPHCGSPAVEKLSEFGSTACKSLWRCTSCHEPFDHFKAI